MLITNLLPLLGSYSLAFDLVAGADGVVTLIIIPRVAEGKSQKAEAGELHPISIIATAAEIDAELAKGAEGALGGLIATRKTLADQIATQRDAAEAVRAASAEAAKAKAASPSPKPAVATSAPAAPAPGALPADAKSEEPASLW
ncbi:PRTRC system protein E [uncultured Sphingomonas sp.]|uniref:PRTRC system protein E n=1 Tax=uncultured Sphingomonas sp. TaxID=158754 RepID=UPI00260D3718|nr:PRTRC system protein E [uncultured Sphingomonas sp.]